MARYLTSERLERVVSNVALVFAVGALGLSWRANQIAEEANAISVRSQLSNVRADYLFQYRGYDDDYKRPCLASGTANWSLEFVVVHDVNNVHGPPISLTAIGGGKIDAFSTTTQARLDYEFFGSRESLDRWFQDHGGPLSLLEEQLPSARLDYGGLPIIFGTGETKRLVIKGTASAEFVDPTPDIVIRSLRDVRWYAPMSFQFSDGTVLQTKFSTVHPYEFEPAISVPPQFQACR